MKFVVRPTDRFGSSEQRRGLTCWQLLAKRRHMRDDKLDSRLGDYVEFADGRTERSRPIRLCRRNHPG
jgi:hypothetical protein